MSDHTKELWRLNDQFTGSIFYEEQCIGRCCEPLSKANARRIVACVNACAGIPTEVLEAMPSGPASLLPMYTRLAQQCDKLLAVLEGLANDIHSLIHESSGVAGLHLNDDLAPWHELEAGGRFERLTHLPIAFEVIAEVKGQS